MIKVGFDFGLNDDDVPGHYLWSKPFWCIKTSCSFLQKYKTDSEGKILIIIILLFLLMGS